MRCEEVQALLEEGGQTPEAREHLAVCAVCAAHAALLGQLRRLAPPVVGKPSRWAVSLPHPPWLWRRPATYLPLLVGAGFVTLGWVGLGRGFPGGQELSLVVRALGEATGLALGEAMLSASRAAAGAWGVPLAASALALALGGVLLLRWARVKVRV